MSRANDVTMKTSKQSKQTLYAAFLRGINVGGHKPIKMEDLKRAFEALGFGNVRTILASGNVVFEPSQAGSEALVETIEGKLKDVFGYDIGVLVRPMKDLQQLEATNPFKGIKVTPQTRLYVTFLSEKPRSSLKIPYQSPDRNFKIIRVTENAVLSVLTVSPESRTTDLMTVLEKEFGRKVTTRNWNTITKLLETSA
jgi:uncharacterized protein (DUF1697 family)